MMLMRVACAMIAALVGEETAVNVIVNLWIVFMIKEIDRRIREEKQHLCTTL
ncbi:hypothetical protein [Neobacillus sp. PS2-9]|uniref:hypothetical protein n=1 Tax=Neobacillus sp. PS2-9 TaxID=3070676 RepID=UPI0027E0920C|nr:hypothetical protein [Neobacillus sp. PS2-9]WML57660.1 hypothetical protein RCG25_22605 [Neobacillus sp. PS2-9]